MMVMMMSGRAAPSRLDGSVGKTRGRGRQRRRRGGAHRGRHGGDRGDVRGRSDRGGDAPRRVRGASASRRRRAIGNIRFIHSLGYSRSSDASQSQSRAIAGGRGGGGPTRRARTRSRRRRRRRVRGCRGLRTRRPLAGVASHHNRRAKNTTPPLPDRSAAAAKRETLLIPSPSLLALVLSVALLDLAERGLARGGADLRLLRALLRDQLRTLGGGREGDRQGAAAARGRRRKISSLSSRRERPVPFARRGKKNPRA